MAEIKKCERFVTYIYLTDVQHIEDGHTARIYSARFEKQSDVIVESDERVRLRIITMADGMMIKAADEYSFYEENLEDIDKYKMFYEAFRVYFTTHLPNILK